jgi:hypothetical protein
MHLVILPSGQGRCIYGEEISLHAIGHLAVSRGSHVEPDEQGQWRADLSPVDGPMLGPFPQRSQALAAEQAWLEAHWLTSP